MQGQLFHCLSVVCLSLRFNYFGMFDWGKGRLKICFEFLVEKINVVHFLVGSFHILSVG